MRWQADWREYVDKIIRSYPDLEQKVAGGGELTEKEKRRFDALRATLAEMEGMVSGDQRMRLIQMTYWEPPHILHDAAGLVGVSSKEAIRWNREFIQLVAEKLDLP